MRTFQALVFDDTVDSSTPLYIDPSYNGMLGGAEKLAVFGVAVVRSGSGTLSVQIEESPNQIYWSNKQVTPEINAVTLSGTTFTTVEGRDSGGCRSQIASGSLA